MTSKFIRRPRVQPEPAICKTGWLKPSSAQPLMRCNILVTIPRAPELNMPDRLAAAFQLRKTDDQTTYTLKGSPPWSPNRLHAELFWHPEHSAWHFQLSFRAPNDVDVFWEAWVPAPDNRSCQYDNAVLPSVQPPPVYAQILITA